MLCLHAVRFLSVTGKENCLELSLPITFMPLLFSSEERTENKFFSVSVIRILDKATFRGVFFFCYVAVYPSIVSKRTLFLNETKVQIQEIKGKHEVFCSL